MQSLRLDQVVKMTHATLMVAPDNRVTRIFVDPPTIRAKVKSMDGDNGKLTVQIDGKEKTFSLQNAKVMNGTRVMRLADLQPDLMATLVLSLDRELLLAVDIR
jgi:hypothetical protein